MSRALEEFIEQFVIPLLGGGAVHVSRPLRAPDHEEWRGSPALRNPDLLFLRLRRAEDLVPSPHLPDPDDDELALWMGLHNTLLFDHPERQRVWARGITWQRVEAATRSFLTRSSDADVVGGIVRHVAVGPFLELKRVDTIVATASGEVRHQGLPEARRARARTAVPAGQRDETVEWLTATHQPETRRLLDDIIKESPLTCLLHPLLAPSGWSALGSAMFLRHRGLARSICHRWAAHRDWVGLGGAVMAGLLPLLAAQPIRARVRGTGTGSARSAAALLASSSHEDDTRSVMALAGETQLLDGAALAAITGALIHLHFLKVLELEARLGLVLSSRDPGILSFLALPLLLPWLERATGSPLAGVAELSAFESQAHRRWGGYVDHLQELVPRAVVENLLSTLVPAVVNT